MSSQKISTKAAIKNGYYGSLTKDQTTGGWTFLPLGKAITLNEVQENIENKSVDYILSFEFFLDRKYVKVDGKDISSTTLLDKLNDAGANVAKKNFDIIVDTIRLQLDEMQEKGPGIINTYNHLGWIRLPIKDAEGNIIADKLCYRAHTLIGDSGKYQGIYAVKPKGKFSVWRKMVVDEVIGNTPLEFVLVIGLSAVVNGLISPYTTHENPIFHIYYVSRSGKSTAAKLCGSTSSEIFNGEKSGYNEFGMPVRHTSLYGTWGSTENATITQCRGNQGAIVVYNELSKFDSKGDMTKVIYNLSEGSDKVRLNQDMQAYLSESYATTFLSIGEHDIYSRCKDKSEGLRNRVMQIEEQFTKDAAHSERILAVCREHSGHAAPMLAEYIIENGGITMCLDVFEKYRDILRGTLPDSKFKESFISKFAALIMATAEISGKALGIEFSIQNLLDYFVEYEKKNAASRDTSKSSYDVIIEECNINKHKFYVVSDSADRQTQVRTSPIGEGWGRMRRHKEILPDGRVVVEEYEVYPSIIDGILKDKHFKNPQSCFEAWKDAGLIDYEEGKNTRKRKVDPFSNENRYVVVFRIFEDSNPQNSTSLPEWVKECEKAEYIQLEVKKDDKVLHTA